MNLVDIFEAATFGAVGVVGILHYQMYQRGKREIVKEKLDSSNGRKYYTLSNECKSSSYNYLK
ncbi:MAG: hypothetical protein AABX93_00725 [Nanoarchaeota archaeon]